jgi:hypothetical protein
MKRQTLPEKLRALLGLQRHRRRALSPTGPMPRPGAQICSGNVRLTVQAGMSESLWRWLSNLGWRTIRFRPDRRRYHDIPDIWVRLLNEARPEQRERVLIDATAAARKSTPHPLAYREAHLRRQAHQIRPGAADE